MCVLACIQTLMAFPMFHLSSQSVAPAHHIVLPAVQVLYLLVLWYVLGRVANAAINKLLARRIRMLQVRLSNHTSSSRAHCPLHLQPSLDFMSSLYLIVVARLCHDCGIPSAMIVCSFIAGSSSNYEEKSNWQYGACTQYPPTPHLTQPPRHFTCCCRYVSVCFSSPAWRFVA